MKLISGAFQSISTRARTSFLVAATFVQSPIGLEEQKSDCVSNSCEERERVHAECQGPGSLILSSIVVGKVSRESKLFIFPTVLMSHPHIT